MLSRRIMKLKKHHIIVMMLVLCVSKVHSEVKYTETEDDFSNKKIYSLKIPSDKGESAAIFVSCYEQNRLDIQLAVTGTMFPDDTKDGGMIISTTHKFDKSETAVTSYWYMNLMKYKNSSYQGDKIDFARGIAFSDYLNIRLNKRNDVFKFPLKGASDYVKKIVKNCSGEI